MSSAPKKCDIMPWSCSISRLMDIWNSELQKWTAIHSIEILLLPVHQIMPKFSSLWRSNKLCSSLQCLLCCPLRSLISLQLYTGPIVGAADTSRRITQPSGSEQFPIKTSQQFFARLRFNIMKAEHEVLLRF